MHGCASGGAHGATAASARCCANASARESFESALADLAYTSSCELTGLVAAGDMDLALDSPTSVALDSPTSSDPASVERF